MANLFGTDGVRGEVNQVLTAKLAYAIGADITHILKETYLRPRIFVGRDTRLSGPMLAGALFAGISASGGDAYDLGIIPTPAVSALVREEGAQAGIVISASHNPYYDNGIKIFGADGKKLAEEMEKRIESMLELELEPPTAKRDSIGRIFPYPQGGDIYMRRLKEHFPLALQGVKVVLDAANGATSDYAETLLTDLGAEVVSLSKSYDGVNINDECGSTKPQKMLSAISLCGANIGIAYDGDGDRLILGDENGQLVDGDQIMAIIATYLKEQGKLEQNTLVVTVMSNLGLKLAMQAKDIHIEETAVGDKFVMRKMEECGAVIGGEQSGHIILSQHNPTGDGMLSSLMILEIMTSTGKTLGELARSMKPLPQILQNINLTDRESWRSNERILQAICDAEQRLSDNGRLLVRLSGTEPLLRIMGEAMDASVLVTIMDELTEIIRKEI